MLKTLTLILMNVMNLNLLKIKRTLPPLESLSLTLPLTFPNLIVQAKDLGLVDLHL